MSLSPQDKKEILALNEHSIGKYVNGKIDRLTDKLDVHIAQHEVDAAQIYGNLKALETKLEPLTSALSAFAVIRRFVLWIAAPLAIMWAGWGALSKWLLPPQL